MRYNVGRRLEFLFVGILMKLWVMRYTSIIVAVTLLGATTSRAQDTTLVPDSLSNIGVERASTLFNAVFVDRSEREATLSGGDLGSYLMARLGVYPIPNDLTFQVTVDTVFVVLFGTIGDLPAAARAVLSPLLGMLPIGTALAADITLMRAGPELIRFHFATARIGGFLVPEGVLARVMTQVGSQYPVLSRTGRDLYVRVPTDGELALQLNGVRIWTRDGAGETKR